MLGDCIISFDVETTGLIPGPFSMISLGAVAIVKGEEHSEFYTNIQELPNAKRQRSTMEFWAQFPDQWEAATRDALPPAKAMNNFVDWCLKLPGNNKNRIFAANPASFDSGFLMYYLYRFLPEEYFAQAFTRVRVLDIRTMIAMLFGKDFSKAQRSLIPDEWTEGLVITHNSLDDARQQARVLIHVANAHEELRKTALEYANE